MNFGSLHDILFFPSLIVGLLVLLFISIWAYTRVYIITPNNEAFVRTGGVIWKGKTVILNGGCIVLPRFHQITRVPLREISIDVERTGKLAVRTQDYLRANMRVTFYVCINPNKDDVLTSAARLSKQEKISDNDIKDALEKRADGAIRAAAKKKSLTEIDSDKLGFANEVLNLIQQDLKKVGLTLNNIAISEIEESDTYDENNFFDAQGMRLRTETIQRSIQQKREVELSTRVAIEQRELQAEKQLLEIAKQKEDAKLTQQKEIELLKAQREREIQEAKDQEAATIARNKIWQEKAVEEEKIQQQLAVQQSQIEANIALEEGNKQLKVAEIMRQQTIEVSRLRSQIEIAQAQRESKIAQQEAAIAIAEKERDRAYAEAEKAKAETAVITAIEVEKAEREKRLSMICAEQEAQKRAIGDRNVIEIDVFRRKRQAEVARQAAEQEAEAIRTLADANRYQATAEAEGKRTLIEAENALSNANRTAKLIEAILPELADRLPEIVKALAPQPGVLGDTRIYAFPGVNGNNNNGASDINKLLLSTSGLALLDTLLDESKLGKAIDRVKQLLTSEEKKSSATLSNLPQDENAVSEEVRTHEPSV
ncbi:MAG: flotillin family protein [Hydrococcus sp. C42_A2020_068]|nr:flotillin family protein [Hydrococcus sp. C42_A2020_068]